MIKPKRLEKDDCIGVISPASGFKDKKKAMKGIEYFESLGYKVKIGRNMFKIRGFLAGTDKERLADLHQMFADKKVDAIICLRGGYGTNRLLDSIDYKLIKNNPKIFCGYSDITALHLAFSKMTNLVTFHSPMVGAFTDTIKKFTINNLLDILTNPETQKEYPIPKGWKKLEVINKGKVKGRLVGGNLSLVVSTLGTPYEIDTKNKIVFLEDTGEESYRLDRYITHLLTAGKLSDASGIIIGLNVDCEPKDKTRQSSREVLIERLKPLKKPLLLGFPFGHIKEQITIPYGIMALLDATNGKLILQEKCVI